jgi:hypothetical protein
MEEFYLINYINDNQNTMVFPDLEQPMSTMIKYLVPENIKCVIIKNTKNIDFRFLYAYKGDFTLEHGAISELTLDLNLAIPIFLNKVREIRDPLFAPLDVQFMKALEQGNTTLAAEIGAKKQELRDITEMDLSSVTDLISLKALWPTTLLGESPF